MKCVFNKKGLDLSWGERFNLSRQIYAGWLIFALGDMAWPPRSPDLSEPYYFLWGYLKSGVYVAKTRNNEEFKVCVRDEIAGIAEVLRRGIKDFYIIYSNIYSTRCNFTQFIYVWKLFYVFRVVPPPIIRSVYNCIYSIWYLSHRYCYLPLSWKSWNSYKPVNVKFSLNMFRSYCFGGSAAFVPRFPQVERQIEWHIHVYVNLFYFFAN
jgi:hypothetical protein